MKQPIIKNSKEIDIVGILKKEVLVEKKTLAIYIVLFAVLGIIVALNTPKRYTSSVVLAPEISGAGGMLDNLSDLASMVGVNVGTSSSAIDAIYPEIYPDILASPDFILELFPVKVKRTDESSYRTYYEYLSNDQKVPFWQYPIIWLHKLLTSKSQNDDINHLNPFALTKQQYNVCNEIRSNISCLVDKKTSVITLSVEDQDPLVAATIVDTVQTRLQQYVTLYRTKKARSDYDYVKKLYEDSKKQYTKARQLYSAYADANQDILLESYKTKRDELENELQLKYNNYNQLSQQLQLAKAKIQERTPVFTVIQGASIPLKASSMPRSVMVIMFVVVGFVFDALWVVYFKKIIGSFRKRK